MNKRTAALIGMAAVLLILAGAICGAAAADNPVNEQQLRAAIVDSGQNTVTLGADITLTTGTLTISRTVTLDLNGKTLARSRVPKVRLSSRLSPSIPAET